MTEFLRRGALSSLGFIIASSSATLAGATMQAQSPANARLRFVVEARQLGPVGYRDPVGAMSPDGQWLAYTSEGRLRLSQVAGGPVTSVGPDAGRLTRIAWLPDSRRVTAVQPDGQGNLAWWVIDVHTGD